MIYLKTTPVCIQIGCNYSCAFCSLEYNNTKLASFSPDEILNTISKLWDKRSLSHKGIIQLSGINVTGYNYNDTTLTDLLYYLIKKTDFTYCLSHINPQDEQALNVIKFINSEKRMLKQIHLATQSLSDTVLDRMNMGYHVERVTELLKETSSKVSCDIIVGFPGETEDEFNETYNYIKLNKIYSIVYKYKDRFGSKASFMNNKISIDIINKRYKHLRCFNGLFHKTFDIKYLANKESILKDRVLYPKNDHIETQGICIQDGCTHDCAFCGPEYNNEKLKYFDFDTIKSKINFASNMPIILSGINVTGYPNLIDLIKRLIQETSFNIGLSHINPADEQALDIVKFINNEPRCIKTITLACQSLSNTVLDKMNVGFHVDRVTELLGAGANIDFICNVIVGFPGETEEEFNETCDYIKSAPFAAISAFEYVDRYRSAAADMNNKIPLDIIKKRYNIVNKLNIFKRQRYPSVKTRYLRSTVNMETSLQFTQQIINSILDNTFVYKNLRFIKPEINKPTKESFIKAVNILYNEFNVDMRKIFIDGHIAIQNANRTDFSDCIDTMRHVIMSEIKQDISHDIQIHYGCNKKCAFCGPEYINHPYVSFAPDTILQDVKTSPHKSIVLSGVNVTGYDYDGFFITDLVKYILRHTDNDIIIGISHINPKDKDVLNLIKFMNKHDRILQYTTLACQSLSNTVLDRMNVGFHVDKVTEVLNAGPNIQFNAQLIVGFPGETEEEFNETLQFSRRFKGISVSEYVDRYRSIAADMENKVSLDIIEKRYKLINDYKYPDILKMKGFYMKNKHAENNIIGEPDKIFHMTQETVNSILDDTWIYEGGIPVKPEERKEQNDIISKPTKESFIKAIKILRDKYNINILEHFKDDFVGTQDSNRTDFSDCIDTMRRVVQQELD